MTRSDGDMVRIGVITRE